MERWRSMGRTLRAVLVAVGLSCAAGCGSGELEAEYGRRSGSGPDSVNGTSAFADLFEAEGHRVASWQYLSPKLQQQADCIVWFPSHFNCPGDAPLYWLETWLLEAPGRTVIFVGRDFDASEHYWESYEAAASKEEHSTVRAERAKSARLHRQHRKAFATGVQTTCESSWFTLDQRAPIREVDTIEGHPWWTTDIDVESLEITLDTRLEPTDRAQVVLSSQEDTIIAREAVGYSQIYYVVNGSFLLNGSLLNDEHRKLAGRLVQRIGPAEKTVYFLEPPYGDPPVLDEDPALDSALGARLFGVEPISYVLLHMAVVGIVFCFSRFPIFGLARSVATVDTSDFGLHVDALGRLLARNRDASYAQSQIAQYRTGERGGHVAAKASPNHGTATTTGEAAETAGESPFSVARDGGTPDAGGAESPDAASVAPRDSAATMRVTTPVPKPPPDRPPPGTP